MKWRILNSCEEFLAFFGSVRNNPLCYAALATGHRNQSVEANQCVEPPKMKYVIRKTRTKALAWELSLHFQTN